MTGSIAIRPVATKGDGKRFIRFPWRIYRGDRNWVPPLMSDMAGTMSERTNKFLTLGPHEFFLAVDTVSGRVVGRMGVGIDAHMNEIKGTKDGYVTLFECVSNYAVAEAMFDYAARWHAARGMTRMRGPISPSNGDDYRGLLVEGFDGPPVLMNSYNPTYYPEFFERYGFLKFLDFYAYHYDLSRGLPAKIGRVAGYALKKYGVTVDAVDFANLEHEISDVKKVLDRAMPEEWVDLVPPSIEELRAMADRLKPMAVPELARIARKGDEPIGLSISMPDYNQVLKHLNGKLFPIGFAKLLYYRRRITGGRFFIMFVVPEYRKKGISTAIYWTTFLAAQKLGYTWGEGSTIGEFNTAMRADAEGAGGRHYRTYRIYLKDLAGEPCGARAALGKPRVEAGRHEGTDGRASLAG